MNLICVDNDISMLRRVEMICKKKFQLDETKTFSKVRDAVEWIESGHSVNIALLGIDGNMNGLILAQNIKKHFPTTVIILLSSHKEFAVDAFKIHASGYLLKPVTSEKLTEAIQYAMQLCH